MIERELFFFSVSCLDYSAKKIVNGASFSEQFWSLYFLFLELNVGKFDWLVSFFSVERGQEVAFADYKGKVLLIVNTASKCGFTPQYGGLETLYKGLKEKYGDDFTILGFPCNQFGSQEPGSDEEIQSFCQINYGVSFPIMQKIDVNGDGAAPLYNWLKEERPGLLGLKRIKWNFEKFLIGRDGKVKGRWASTTKPESLEAEIIKELDNKVAE